MHILQSEFHHIVTTYNAEPSLTQALWADLEKRYTHKSRHYHNLEHLLAMYGFLSERKSTVQDWDTLFFALMYHDAVYNTLKDDNETQSAKLAQKCLLRLRYPEMRIAICSAHITATKTHEGQDIPDRTLLLDADLSILASEWPTYLEYTQKIRREYAIFPDLIYRPGRTKVLQHFLNRRRIFQDSRTPESYEEQARENLGRELEWLQR